MAEKEVLLTREGLEKLEGELDYLIRVRRREVAERIKEALGFGDISENSEYDAAKDEQAQVEARISKIRGILRNAVLINNDEDDDTEEVKVGYTVVVKELGTGKEWRYKVVGSAEADPSNHRISNESPVGRALLGKTIGDQVAVTVPAGVLHFEILDINK
ncbi:MAG: transcription elongation factor GreA [Limnochordia bacterium]|jgi:transcription elongation factor GreA|nr:transcription elongation factor GreA [Limnochordia bacterium]MDD2630347.1 transcription elongation factor GreA [Limnochordia bacterium]MDD2756840.1 transcription elongation factor GreA [Methanothrix sp.]MDD4518737.1 transcription elongation factor GreA [Limnochordia bacterium]